MVLGALGFLAASACSDAFSIEDVIGVWEATQINGCSVPGTVVVEGEGYDTQYFRWTLVDGGVWSLIVQIHGDVDSDGCEYTVDLEQRTIAIVQDHWDLDLKGCIDGDRMTLTDSEGVDYVLQRQ